MANVFMEEQCLISLDGEECCVCTDKLIDNVIELPCDPITKHAIHTYCIKSIIDHQENQEVNEVSCPMCRTRYNFKIIGDYTASYDFIWSIYKYSIPIIYVMMVVIPSIILINMVIFYNWYNYYITNKRDLTYVYFSCIYMIIMISMYVSIFTKALYAYYCVNNKKYDNLLEISCMTYQKFAIGISNVGLPIYANVVTYVPLIIYLAVPEPIKYDVLLLFIVLSFIALIMSKVIFKYTTKWYSNLLDAKFMDMSETLKKDLCKTYYLVIDEVDYPLRT